MRVEHPSSLASILGELRRDRAGAVAEAGPSSLAALTGVQIRMRRRLGELPGPVGSNGPAISPLRRYAPLRVSAMLTPAGYGRRNGSRAVSGIASLCFANATCTR